MMIREPPVGSSDSDSYHETHSAEKIKLLEEERDNLQKNMISLTSRMAQIEFRMSQVVFKNGLPLDYMTIYV